MTNKIKAKSVHVFDVRLWSRKHYGKDAPKSDGSIWNGIILDRKDKDKHYFFHSAGDLLKLLEKLYFQQEEKQ